MGLFSRRKSSTQSFASQSTHPQSYYHQPKSAQRAYPGQESWDFDSAPVPSTSLSAPNNQTNNAAHERKSSTFSAFGIRARQPTGQNEISNFPTLTAKQPKKNERPPSAASRVFVTNGQAITRDGKPPPPRNRSNTKSEPVLPRDISATNILRPTQSMRALKVKSVDLLKSNPRLSYLTPPAPPPPTLARIKSDELTFHHDGRGLFTSKTVANLADELDTHGLRTLLERDSRRHSRYPSQGDLRRPSSQSHIPGEIPSSPREREYEPYQQLNPISDPGPSTIRPVLGSDRSSGSMEERRQRMDSGKSGNNVFPPERKESIDTIKRTPPRRPELPPILIFGQSTHREPEQSPILLMGPTSARSTETQSTHPHSLNDSPIQLFATRSSEHYESPQLSPRSPVERPPISSMPTDTISIPESSIQENEYETADELLPSEGEDTPGQTPIDTQSIDSWHDSPIIPGASPIIHADSRQQTPKPKAPKSFSPLSTEITPIRVLHEEMTPRPNTAVHLEPGSRSVHSDVESGILNFEDDLHGPIFPEPQWKDSPIIGSAFPVPPQSQGSASSEGSWLSGKKDIEEAVRKSFAGSPARRASPILLEAGTASGDGMVIPSGIAESSHPDYEGVEYEDENIVDEFPEESVRQGSAAKKVEVVDHRPSLEAIVGRVSNGDSPERKSQDI